MELNEEQPHNISSSLLEEQSTTSTSSDISAEEAHFKNIMMSHTMVDEMIKKATKGSLTGLYTTKEVLSTIVRNAEDYVSKKQEYNLKCRSHNQYGLFNLLDYIDNYQMDGRMYEAITFRECLLISKAIEDPEDSQRYCTVPVGGICIDIQKAEGAQPMERLMEEYEVKLLKFLDHEGISDHITGCGDDSDIPRVHSSEPGLSEQNSYGYSKFVVHVSSQFDVEGKNGGSTITAFVDRNCHTIEELRKEFIASEDNNVSEKTLYTALKRRWYYVKHTASVESIDTRKLYSVEKARNFVSEAANFVLMRYLALRRFYGRFELACAYINGDLCKNIYECFGPQESVFHGARVDCCKIRRTIIEECGLQRTSVTVLTLTGRILKQEWDKCDYIFLINPYTRITDQKPSCLDDSNLEVSWTEDLQLMSAYLDFKERCLMEAKSYDSDHPELRQLMADYVNQILRLRPPDIRSFTENFFRSFVSTHLPRCDYFE